MNLNGQYIPVAHESHSCRHLEMLDFDGQTDSQWAKPSPSSSTATGPQFCLGRDIAVGARGDGGWLPLQPGLRWVVRTWRWLSEQDRLQFSLK